MSLDWDFSTLADQLASAVAREEDDLRLEQAVYGLDALAERALQHVLARRLSADYEVAREVHYPSSGSVKLSHRARCDVVLSPKGSPLKLESSAPSLFDPQSSCLPEKALWIEVKVAYQFREGSVRHSGYGQQWRQAVVSDLAKMEADPAIHYGGLALLVFNESKEILQKDLELFEDVLMQKEVLAGFRHVRSVEILDRIGHRFCSVAVWPPIQRG